MSHGTIVIDEYDLRDLIRREIHQWFKETPDWASPYYDPPGKHFVVNEWRWGLVANRIALKALEMQKCQTKENKQ